MCEACVVVGGGGGPIYEGGQCGQNQFYSSEIYREPRRRIQTQRPLCGSRQLRPSPAKVDAAPHPPTHISFLNVNVFVFRPGEGWGGAVGSACFIQAHSGSPSCAM